MRSNCFEKLILQARELDDGIEKLTNTWKVPHIMVGGFAKCTEETNADIKAIWSIIRSSQDTLEEIQTGIENYASEQSVDIEELLQTANDSYEEMKSWCDEFSDTMTEHEYQCKGYNNATKVNAHSTTESSQLSLLEMENLEDESNASLNEKSIDNSDGPLSPVPNGNITQDAIATPVITSLASALKMQTSITSSNFGVSTPLRQRPLEPIYSKHFYNIFNK